MRVGNIAASATLALSPLWTGCFAAPDGYDALVASVPGERVVHTGGWMVGEDAVRSYDLPGGRVARYQITHRRARVLSERRELAFEVRLGDGGTGPRLRCQTDVVDPDGNHARFACWSEGDARRAWFTIASGVPGCNVYEQRQSDPRCWEGRLVTDDGTYDVVFGTVRAGRLTSVSEQVVWKRGAAGVQAIDARGSENLFELHRGTSQSLGEDGDTLLLHAVALHLWIRDGG